MYGQPLVSIIIPAYNAEKYIKRSIDSALQQTYKNIEIVVVDDGSTDRTAEILKSYNDPRIVYRYQKNQNQGVARNHGIKICRGDFITFLDADDLYLPEKIEKSVEFFSQNTDYSIAYCNVFHFFSQNPGKFYRLKHTGYSGDVLERLLKGSFININSIMISRDLFEKNGITFIEERYYPEDYELYLQFALLGYKFGYIDSDLVVIEIHPDSDQYSNTQVLRKNTIHLLGKYYSIVPEEKKTILNSVIRSKKIKMAAACLLEGDKKTFLEVLMNLTNPALKVPVFLLGKSLTIIPSSLLSCFLEKALKVNRRRYYCAINELPRK